MPAATEQGERLSPVAWAITALCLLWIYCFGIAGNPARWEEPRRCLVTMEMIHSGDYVVPRVLGESYLKKPPLYNWMIALAAGNEFQRADAFRARVVTLVTLLALVLLLWRLGIDGGRGSPHLLPALIAATMMVFVQSGRAGEMDVPFAACTTAALGTFELGRRRGSPWLQWFVPQLFVAAGVLTKGFAPLFFYPPVLFCAWKFRSRIRFSPVPFLAGLGGMLLLVGAWVVPYSRLTPVDELQGSWVSETIWVFKKAGVSGLLKHPIAYPLMVVGSAMPWTIYLFVMGADLRRDLLQRVRSDPFAGLCAACVVWTVLVYAFFPGVSTRYLLPALPFAAILIADAIVRGGRSGSAADRRLRSTCRHWLFWAGLLVLLLGYSLAAGGKLLLDDPRVLSAIVVGLFVISGFAWLVFRRREVSAVVPLLLLGLIGGVAFAGVWEARRARKTTPFVETAARFAAKIDAPEPVVCDCGPGAGHRLAYNLGQAIGRPVQRATPPAGAYYLVTPLEQESVERGARLVESFRYALWKIEPDDSGSAGP